MDNETYSSARRHVGIWKILSLQTVFACLLLALTLYVGLKLSENRLVEEQVLNNARTNFQGIVLTRMWNAQYGGVYVEKTDTVVSNPFLNHPDIQTTDGRTLTLRNPALMTREISDLANAQGLFRYRITSLKPLNPANAPDAFEEQALLSFERGTTEAFEESVVDDRSVLRYMGPLVVTQECLKCHAQQGYLVGDIRGGISVMMDVTPYRSSLAISQPLLLWGFVILAILAISAIGLLTYTVFAKLGSAYAKAEKMEVTDELTGLSNRRIFFQRLDEEVDRARRYGTNLSLIMIDIDRLRQTNMTFGNPKGDLVLAEVARLLNANIRRSDFIARYGGEEFIVMIPSAGINEAALVAEKLRTVIEVNDIALEGPELTVTISAGVADIASIAATEMNLRDALIRAADRAMYLAKSQGRNRVARHMQIRERQLPLI